MVTELRYDNPFGPMVRIGILENQEGIKFSVLGSYKVVDSEGNEQLQLQDSDIIYTARVQESRPATMQWRILLSSVTNRETALARAEMAEKKLSLTRTDIIEVGNDVIATSGIRLSARSYWVCTAPFTTEQEAIEARRKFKDASRYEILAERITPPSGIITLNNETGSKTNLSFNNYFELIPIEEVNSRIILYDVIVGIAYHWRHKERQKLRGRLRIIVDNQGKLTAINILPLEQYLISVNSSEMMAVCPEELLKAQTIAARNTVLATMGKHHYGQDFDL
ncbi:MAG: SpoIID/LytB domain-containing protein, partial [Candidatus Sumerlaeia bacterium]|nr:SpoIID/LytB domain-containing protein [Candidatus Sumerlaeia bacterium]